MARTVLAAAGMILAARSALAAEPSVEGGTVIRLWDGPAPLAKGESKADIPTLTLHKPAKGAANGCAVVICPGGGYRTLVTSYEGREVAEWMNSLGVTALVLRYRVAPYRHPAPLIDVQRAIRTIRSRAAEFQIDPDRIGIIGFSAGGHAASAAATLFDEEAIPPADPIDRASARPDFAILAYPVISFDDSVTHGGSKKNLLGPDPAPALVHKMSTDEAVTKKTPPVFLFHTAEDSAVPAENSVRFYRSCLAHDVPSELHIFERGKHGAGLGQDDPVLKAWPSLCEAWMRRHGWLDTTTGQSARQQ